MTTVKFGSALDVAAKIQTGECTPLEVVQHYLRVIDSRNPELNAFCFRRDESLLEEAATLTARLKNSGPQDLPPFFGVPIAIKALTSVTGWPIDHCSKSGVGRREVMTHAVVQALQQAGFLLLGQTTSPELASVPITESALNGATKNPWNTAYSPGGSSGGAAAAVAAGMSPVAEASDGGGSIRIPASCCGLVGMKPSRGRVWTGPIFCESTITTKGVVTRDVADTAALLDILTTCDPLQWNPAPEPARPFAESFRDEPKQLRIAFSAISPLGGAVDPECVAALEMAARLCADLGHEVSEGAPEWNPVEEFVDQFMKVWAAHVGDYQTDTEDLLEPHNRFLREQAAALGCTEYRMALVSLQRISRRIASFWGEGCDVLLTPTIATLPPRIGSILGGAEKDPQAPFFKAFEIVPFTPWFNVTGQPAVSLPLSLSESGLPIGVQAVARFGEEATLLQLARQLESTAGFPKLPESL